MNDKDKKDYQEPQQFRGYLQKMNEFFENSPIRNMFEEMNSFFDKSFFSVIPIDIYETERDLIIQADIPGSNKNHIHIDIMGDTLKISVNQDTLLNNDENQTNFYKRERSYMHASRSVKLPYPVDRDSARATYQNGILEIKIPLSTVKVPPIEIE